MSNYIGNDRCTRCGGGSGPCPVCNPVEEETRGTARSAGEKYCRFCDKVSWFYESSPGRCADCRKARQKAAYRLNPQPQRDRVYSSHIRNKQARLTSSPCAPAPRRSSE